MHALLIDCLEGEAELLSAELWEQGAHGIQEEPLPGGRCRLRAWFDHADGLAEQFGRFHPRLTREPEIDWDAHVRQAWQPFLAGRRFYVAPEWDESPTPSNRVRLIVHPGQALGTGAHPATQLCLEAMERHLRPRDAMLDVGTGSGILMSAARLLGATRAVGCDIDLEALRIAQGNLLADAVPPSLYAGSARSARAGAFDLVVANINAAAHAGLASSYAAAARRTVILSGFQQRHGARVADAMAAYSFTAADTLARDEWICLVFLRDEVF